MKNESKAQPAAKAAVEQTVGVVAVPVDAPVEAPVELPAPAVEATAEQPADDVAVRAEAARSRAAQLIAERRFGEAKVALEEAEAIESPEPAKIQHRVMSAVRYRLQRLPKPFKAKEEPAKPAEVQDPEAELAAMAPEDRAVAIVGLYSKIAAVAGLVPGGLLNFAAILAVQVTMVWRIANTFGHRESRTRIRGVIMALFGSAVPTALGGGVMFGVRSIAVRSLPTFIAGTVAGFVVTPVFAYAMTKAIGSVFVMHFESGGTLLTFDPKAFREYFIKEFQEAGGTLAVPTAN
jgi:uncharacterized protein (DUF697 family)